MSDLDKEPAINWLVQDWIADKEFSVFWGDPGTYKSFACQGLSLQLALAGKRCVYVAAEGASGLASRVHAWNALNRGDPYRHSNKWWYMPVSVPMDEKKEWTSFSNSMNETLDSTPDLVVLDTLARNFSGDENSSKEMGAFVEGVEQLRRDNECAVWVLHHANVSQENKRERGSAALRAASFGMYRCSNPRKMRDGASIEFECDRLKDGNPPDPVRIDLHSVGLDINMDGEIYRDSLAMRPFPDYTRPAEADDDEPKVQARSVSDEDLIGWVESQGSTTGREVAKEFGWSSKAANRKLHKLAHRNKRLRKDEDGVYFPR